MIAPEPTNKVIEAFERGTPIDEALREAAAQAFQRHSWSKVPMAIWKDGRVVLIDPNAPSVDVPKSFAPPRSRPMPWNPL